MPQQTSGRRTPAHSYATSHGPSYGSSYGSTPRSGGPRRPRSSGGRSGSGGGARRPSFRPAPAPSPLEAELTAAAARPEPEPRPFAAFGLPESLVSTLARRGMAAPFAIQTRVLPDALAGRDVLGRAQTGSGKTLAFGIPVLARLHGNRSATRTPFTPRALILVPTRELARQVADALIPLASGLDLKVTTVVGGLSMTKQIDALRRGVDVVVATPGRLIDLMERNSAKLGAVEISVIDEADHMADLGFLPAVRRILDATPHEAQRLLLSATLDGGVDQLVRDYLSDPAFHAVAQTVDAATAMDHKIFMVRSGDKATVAAEIAARPSRTLFFVRTKHGADRLARQMSREGVEAAAIHGNLNQNQRQRTLDAFAAGRARVLVATDVAARGIHVDDVDLVVHFDLPADHKDYLHRSGRTARAGNRGTVVSFVEYNQSRDIANLHRQAGVTPSSKDEVAPGHEAVRELASSGTAIEVKPLPERPDRPQRGEGAPGNGDPRRRRPQGGRPQGSGRSQGGYQGNRSPRQPMSNR